MTGDVGYCFQDHASRKDGILQLQLLFSLVPVCVQCCLCVSQKVTGMSLFFSLLLLPSLGLYVLASLCYAGSVGKQFLSLSFVAN